MSNAQTRYVLVYDVPSDKRRNKIATVLEGYGQRVQYSVFECLLTGEQFDALWKEMGDLVEKSDASVRAYRLCAACGARTRTLGDAEHVVVPDVYVV